MLGIIYILLCFLTGYCLCSNLLPQLNGIGQKSFGGKKINLSDWLVLIPAWYLIGTLFVTWFTYLSALIISVTGLNSENPLAPANACTFIFFIAVDALLLFRMSRKNLFSKSETTTYNRKIQTFEIIFLILVFLLITYLMFGSFYVKDGQLYVSYSVTSDFAVHLGMIRSFSYGNNFPTQYSHFAGEDIRNHFMFEFLVGNLEYLGMRIDFAFNIPSIISMLSTCSLLYVLAVKIIGIKFTGILSVVFFLFRSSPSFFRYLAKIPSGTTILQALSGKTDFVSYTTNESWGLYNLKVYSNQRHLCFSLSIMLLILILFMPYVYQMFGRLAKKKKNADNSRVTPREFCKEFIFNVEAWIPNDPIFSVCMGLLLGAIAFWNGAVLIACLLILFFMALASNHRLDYLSTAIIALCLSMLQSTLFVDGSAVSPTLYIGYLADSDNLWGIIEFMLELWGVLIVLSVTYLFVGRGIKRYLTFVFLTPLVFALTFSLTPDISVNHKYIIISAMLLSIIVAWIVTLVAKGKAVGCKLLAVLLSIAMTITGVYDFYVLIQINKSDAVYSLDDPVITWIDENTDSQDIFLTSYYSLHKVVLGGAMLYYGWPYYAWSAGYDTSYREEQVKLMYEASSSAELISLIEENDISFIIVDYETRTNEGYSVNEEVIADTYEAVYQEGEGEWMFTIYDTAKVIE